LGLFLKPHPQIDLDTDLRPVLAYIQAKQLSAEWYDMNRNALAKFRRFLLHTRGLLEIKTKPYEPAPHTQGLPDWLVTELARYQRVCQRNWRPARLEENIMRFWSGHLRVWRFLCEQRGVKTLADVRRKQLDDYAGHRLELGNSVTTVNGDLRGFQCFMAFLQEQEYPVPQALLRIPSLKPPDSLPKYLTDEQVKALRLEIEREVREARTLAERRQALFDRAVFYLLWQGGLRLGETEELRPEDLDLSARRLTVRSGKGLKDRSVYLTENVMQVLKAYLAVRGQGTSDHVFLYRNAAVSKDLIRSRLKTIGKRVGVKVYPHRLRDTCATQLLNAGGRVTSIQAFLGHKKLNTTMIYARAHDQTVAEDYFTAMSRVEQRLEIAPVAESEPMTNDEVVKVPEPAQLLAWVEQLARPELCQNERLEIAASLKQALSQGLARQHAPLAVCV
jgi:site-specific recombinase XerD